MIPCIEWWQTPTRTANVYLRRSPISRTRNEVNCTKRRATVQSYREVEAEMRLSPWLTQTVKTLFAVR